MIDLAVVVLAHGPSEPVLDAVASLHGQSEAAELVLSHSGSGDGPRIVAERFPDVRVVSSERTRLPGAARNAGVAATSAPFVAFLAADCLARPGWVEARKRRHGGGAGAVASAMVPGGSASPTLAAYVLQHSGRMPHRRLAPAHRFGVSYARALIERMGGFPEHLERCEDLAFNRSLLAAGEEVVWAPEVQTVHRYAEGVGPFLADAWHRGRSNTVAQDERTTWFRLAEPSARAGVGVLRAASPRSPLAPRELARALPLIAAGALAGTGGAVTGLVANR